MSICFLNFLRIQGCLVCVCVFDFIATKFFNLLVLFLSLFLSVFQKKIFRWMLDQSKKKWNETKRTTKKLNRTFSIPCQLVYFYCLLLILIEESQYKIAFHNSWMWSGKASVTVCAWLCVRKLFVLYIWKKKKLSTTWSRDLK